MRWLMYGIAVFVLIVSASIALVIARLNNHPDWFGRSLDRFQALSLVCDLAPGVASDEATNVRGVETHDFWEGWDRWVTFELPSADAVDALEQAVLSKAELLASRQISGGPGAVIRGGEYECCYPSKSPPGWWAESKVSDRKTWCVSYGGTGVFDVWVFSQSQRRAYLWCDR